MIRYVYLFKINKAKVFLDTRNNRLKYSDFESVKETKSIRNINDILLLSGVSSIISTLSKTININSLLLNIVICVIAFIFGCFSAYKVNSKRNKELDRTDYFTISDDELVWLNLNIREAVNQSETITFIVIFLIVLIIYAFYSSNFIMILCAASFIYMLPQLILFSNLSYIKKLEKYVEKLQH